uniref:Vir7 protein n=1 Tax=Plasmodium vivax TaxID=5855 RepID=Q9N899_PLAVI|nr:vir7 [Plasmodium vivax]
MAEILGDEKLEILPTKHNYYYLDNGYTFCEKDIFYNHAERKLSSDSGLQKVFEKILKAMCYMYTKKRHKIFDSDMCKFFYYWLADILINNLNDNHFTSEVLINLYRILNEAGAGKICDPINSYIDKDNFENIKLIFDYSEDYESYKLDLAIPNRSCNENYKKYLQTYVNKYKELHGYCEVEKRSDTYCKEFHKHFSNKEHNLLSTWSCNLEGTKLQLNLIGDNQGKVVEEAQIGKSSTGKERGAELKETKVEGRAQAEPPVLTASSLETGSSLMSSSSEVEDSSSISTTSKYIANVASVAGIVIPSYLVYNFTPAGTWINRLFGRTPKMNHNTLADMELINNFSQTGSFNTERSRFDISYRPV